MAIKKSTLDITWNDSNFKGEVDLFPLEWFKKNGKLTRSESHFYRKSLNGRLQEAECEIAINSKEKFVDLTYEDTEKNRKYKNELGVLRIHFLDEEFEEVDYVEWKKKGAKDFKIRRTNPGFQGNYSDIEDVDTFEEGRKITVSHLRHERNSRLIREKKDKAKNLKCEVCDFDFLDKYGSLGEEFCEVHHIKPLSKSSKSKTSLKDLAIVCSNCHRMIHRYLRINNLDEVGISKFKRFIEMNRAK